MELWHAILDYHLLGGWEYMILLSIILLLNIGLIAYVTYYHARGKEINSRWIETIKQLGGFALAWGAFSTLIGLFQIFRDIEAMQEVLPVQVISGGLKVALITTLYGFGVFHFTLFAVIILQLTRKEKA